MRNQKNRMVLAGILSILCILIISATANAQAMKTSVGDILSNPNQYDGKMVQIEGKVTALKAKISKKGNPYFTFKLFEGDKSTTVFNFGGPSIREGDSVRVIGMYQKVKHVGRYTFYNEIDASKGSVGKL